MKRFIPIVIMIALLPAGMLFGQSAEILDGFLGQEEADVPNAAYLVFVAAGMLDESASPDEAMRLLEEQKWGEKIRPDKGLNLGEFALLVMRTLEIPGGFNYAIFHSRRHAAREFVFKGFLPGNSRAGRILTPMEAVNGLGAALEWKEARE